MSGVRVVIFAKAPLPGMAKTRLIPTLGAQGAADLARRMLSHTLAQALAADVGPVELCVTPSPIEALWQSLAIPASVAWSDQGEGNLGTRMARATQRVTGAGESVLIIGTDCPALDAGHLRRAAASLKHFDATLVPTADGGYVLLGVNRFHASIFADIEWSTHSVASETLSRLEQLGWKVQNNPMLHDIDEPADLGWLPPAWLGAANEHERETNR
jgi:rSAM/selenodomain-associated transferase 1